MGSGDFFLLAITNRAFLKRHVLGHALKKKLKKPEQPVFLKLLLKALISRLVFQ